MWFNVTRSDNWYFMPIENIVYAIVPQLPILSAVL